MLSNPLNLLTAEKHNWAQSQRQRTHEFCVVVSTLHRCTHQTNTVSLYFLPRSLSAYFIFQCVELFFLAGAQQFKYMWFNVWIKYLHQLQHCVVSGCLPFASEVWGPQTWNACSQWHPRWHHRPGTRAGSSCWCHWTEVGTAWRALIGRWHPNSSCRSLNCCSWPTAPLSKPC